MCIRDRGKDALIGGHAQEIVSAVCKKAQPGDVILVMSNGGFDGSVLPEPESPLLKQNAQTGYRGTVSYTHLDVYKRQENTCGTVSYSPCKLHALTLSGGKRCSGPVKGNIIQT